MTSCTLAPPASTRGSARLWGYGVGMLVPALYFAVRYPLSGNAEQLADLGILSGYAALECWAFVFAQATLFALYGLALRECRRLAAARALPVVFSVGATLAVCLATTYPAGANDVFLYAARSRLLTTYGANPNAARPEDYPADPWRPFVIDEWADDSSPYGPLWNLIAAPITLLADARLPLALVGFKVLATLATLVGAWAIARMLAATPGGAPATGALCYLWNPLVLWEGIGNAHNDVVVILLVLLAFLAWTRGCDTVVLPLLVAATLVKYAPGVLLPVAATALWRRAGDGRARRRLLGTSVAYSGLIVAVALAPFFDVGALRTSLAGQGAIVLTSPLAAVAFVLEGHLPRAVVEGWGIGAGTVALLLTLLWGVRTVWRRPAHLPHVAVVVVTVLLLVATWQFRGWYLIWLVGLTALVPPGWATMRAWAWTAGAMAVYAPFIWLWGGYKLPFAPVHNVGVAIIFGPVILVLLTQAWRRRATGPGLPTARPGPSS